MNKRVLYITFMQNYFNTLVQRTNYIIDDMNSRDDITKIDVVIIDNSQKENVQIVKKEGKITYHSVKIIPSWKWGFGHISNPLKMFIRLKKFNKSKYDYIIAETPWGGLVGVLFKFINRTNTLIYEDMDYFKGFYTKSKIRRFLVGMLEKIVLCKSDLIITIGSELEKMRKKQTSKHIEIIPNGVKYERFASDNDKTERKNTLVYMGKLDDWAGVDLVIKSIPIINKEVPDIKLLVIGAGSYEDELIKLAREMNLDDNIEFLGLKKPEELAEYLQISDIGIATFKDIDLMKYACTLKVLEYGAGGLPVVATGVGETKDYISRNECGITINYDVNECAQAVLKLLSDKELYYKLSKNGMSSSKSLDWKSILDKRYILIEDFLKNKK